MMNWIKKKLKLKKYKPQFPSTFLFENYVYEQWNKKLINNGWTKKEIKQGWRYIK